MLNKESFDHGFFGFENGNQIYNCYLNVIFQVLWHIEPMKQTFIRFLDKDVSGQKEMNPKIKRFLEELKRLLEQIMKGNPTNQFSLNSVRRELFKVFYPDPFFELNQKGDASEAFSVILKLFHQMYLSESIRKKCSDLESSLDAACNENLFCTIHQIF